MKRALLLLGLWLAGCADDNRDRPLPPPATLPVYDDPGSGPADCEALSDSKLELQTISDFEMQGSATYWYFNHDLTGPSEPPLEIPIRKDDAGVTHGSVPAAAMLNTIEIPGGRCGSARALHVRGGPFRDYGGGLGYSGWGSRMDPPPPEDASAWDGIVFWARALPESRKNLRLDVSDINTDDGQNGQPQDGGLNEPPRCTSGAPENGPSVGCDKFGAFATLDNTWRPFTVDFDEMRQAGWGLQQKVFATDQLYGMSFNFAQGYWDFWIDDVAFFRRKR
jgi:hypothetical protein